MSTTLHRRLEPAAKALQAAVPDMLVGDYMQHAGELVVEQGGQLASDSTGASIYPGRADLTLTTKAWDPALRRYVSVKVRLRITVEPKLFNPTSGDDYDEVTRNEFLNRDHA
jgi:hypothetical protein